MKAYGVITQRIIEKLEAGTVPWHQPWVTEGPRNLASKRPYRGINVFVLGCQGHASPYWLTFQQAKDLGGHVRTGEKATPVVFWKWLEVERDNPETGKTETGRVPLLRYYSVFNVEQCELPAAKVPALEERDFQPIARAEHVVSNMPNAPTITFGQARCSASSRTWLSFSSMFSTCCCGSSRGSCRMPETSAFCWARRCSSFASCRTPIEGVFPRVLVPT